MNHHKAAWQAITSDTHILNMIEGYELEFEAMEPPVQTFVPQPYKLSNEEISAVNEEISRLNAMGVIEHSMPESGEFISNIFTRKKKDGGYRMILDLSHLNKFIEYHHFKMDSLTTALQFITEDCFMASLDIRDAYYSVPIATHHRKYLKFRWNGTLWQFRALPNGLSSGPRIFTKLLKPPLATLRSYGHTVIAYIDDTLLVAKTRQGAKEAVTKTAELFSELGFIIHPTKSITEPIREIKFLGFVIDSHAMEIRLTEEKAQEIVEQCTALLKTNRPTIRVVSSVIGKLVATFPGVQQGPLHYRELEKEKIWSLKLNKGHFDRRMSLTQASVKELTWWIENVTTAKKKIGNGTPTVHLSSDASGQGWGASNGSVHIGGRWNDWEKEKAQSHEINYLEMRAAFLALQSFCANASQTHVLLQIDNTTAVTYINNMGGIKSPACNTMAQEIWEWCLPREIFVTAQYLPGSQNVIADRKSRQFNDQIEWKLDETVFLRLCSLYGKPDVDLFASRLNAQVEKYVSWKPDPSAIATDAFSLSWGGQTFYAFPPFCLIAKCLRKIEADEANGFMIVPKWPTQSWFAKLLSLLVDEPIILPTHKNIITLPTSHSAHPLYKRLNLMCCRLSGESSKVWAFQQRLPTSSYHHGGQPQENNTQHTSNNGWNFAINGRLIQCRRL